MPRAVIFANGEIRSYPAANRLLREGDWLIAADGGHRHAQALGVVPAVVIGDMDSIPPEVAERLRAAGAEFITHPADKDETDLELAIDCAVARGCAPIVVMGALGGRTDQMLANLNLLTRPDATAIGLQLDDGLEAAFLIDGQADWQGATGETISLLPVDESVEGVETDGLAYPLAGETLYRHHTRGISNRMLAGHTRVSIKKGRLICVHIRNG